MNLATESLPHAVPATVGVSVLIRDGAHKGTLVTNLVEQQGGFLFASLDVGTCELRPRCVLVAVADPVTKYVDGYEVEESDWQAALPDDVLVCCDLDGKGYALLGLEKDTEIDERCGVVLWDSSGDAAP